MDSSNFWKLDKIDKIGIALIFIVFAIYSTFSCFASEFETLEPIIVEHLRIDQDGTFKSSSDSVYVGYIQVEPGYRYTFSSSSPRRISCSNDIPVVDGVSDVLGSFDNYSFNGGSFGYLYFDYQHNSSCVVTREKLTGMTDSVDLLSGNVGFNVWESFTNTIVYALPITITCFGIYIICGFIKRFSKGV